MSRHDSAPTHGWVISSRINKWLALIFMVLLLVTFIAVWTVRYGIERDCSDIYKRDLTAGGYWLHFEVGSTKSTCPQYGY